jgi:hypothetical protein
MHTRHPIRFAARQLSALSALLGLAATPAASSAQRAAVAKSCIAGPAIITPARLDSVHRIYVEQEVVSAQRDGRVLVAGKPIYLWRSKGEGFEHVEQDSIIGIVIDTSFGARALTSPLPGRAIAGLRAAPMDDGWWVLTFAEVIPARIPKEPLILAMWSGETDGAQWRSVERLPAVSDSMATWSMSPLLWDRGRTTLAVPARLLSPGRIDDRIVFFERRNGKWTTESRDFGMRSYVAVGASATHEILAVVRSEVTDRADRNSLFTYVRRIGDSAWVQHSRLVRGGGHRPSRDPTLHRDGDGVVLSWRVSDDARGVEEAWYTRLEANGDTTFGNVKLADQASVMYPTIRDGRGAWILMGALPEDGREMLKLIEYDGTRHPSSLRISSSPYRGLLGIALTKSRLVLIGSRESLPERTDPLVSTIVHAFPWRCPAQ